MKKVLLLGAGLVARPLARYLLEKGFSLTVVDQAESRAAALIGGHPNGRAGVWTTDDKPGLAKLVAAADLAVSLLPAPYHPLVAEECIALGKPMVTASYVSPAMRALDAKARQAGVLILNEIGVDPGIDHMSAMKVIDRVKSGGGKVLSFKSYCGGLPAPEANNNPWGYKFSWSPRGALLAGRNSARYLTDGRQIDIPGPELFDSAHILDVPGLGELEAYPNRDSMSYIELYGLQGAATVFRGTLRYKNWCAAMLKIANSGLLDERERDLKGMTFRQFSASLLPGAASGSVKDAFAAMLGAAPGSREIQWLDWLGLFGDEPLPLEKGAPVDVMAARMVSKMSYAAGERDMLVMHHEFIADYPADGRKEKITSTLIDFGIPGGDTSMARTVSLPAAMAARLILEGKISGTGIQIPVTAGIYAPVLKELEEMENGIHFRETSSALAPNL
jgi:saccharopine dehydrogenase-like NADP-dependent oxidoreductase